MKAVKHTELFHLIALHRQYKRTLDQDNAEDNYDRMLEHATYLFGNSASAFRIIDALGAYEHFCTTTCSEEMERLSTFLGFEIEDDMEDEDELGDDEEEEETEDEDDEDDYGPDDPRWWGDPDPYGCLELQADCRREAM